MYKSHKMEGSLLSDFGVEKIEQMENDPPIVKHRRVSLISRPNPWNYSIVPFPLLATSSPRHSSKLRGSFNPPKMSTAAPISPLPTLLSLEEAQARTNSNKSKTVPIPSGLTRSEKGSTSSDSMAREVFELVFLSPIRLIKNLRKSSSCVHGYSAGTQRCFNDNLILYGVMDVRWTLKQRCVPVG